MKTWVSRRRFLRTAVATGMALPLCQAFAGFGPIKRQGGALLKPTLNAFSFLELLNENKKDPTKGIDLFGVCDYCAKHDIEGLDATGYFFPGYPQVPHNDYVHRLKRYAHALGITITGTGVRNDFVTADQDVRSAGVQHAKEWIEVAAKLGASTIRLFADSQPPFKTWQAASNSSDREPVEKWLAECLQECAQHAKKFGILIGVQNHGDFIASGEQHLSLLKRVDHEYCMALVDTGKYITPDPYVDIALMAPYAVNWQIKETLHSRTDSPSTDYKKLVAIIRESGYRGFLPIETLSMRRKNYDPYVEVSHVLREMRAAIATAESR